MKKKLSKQELALKKIASAQQAYVNDHIADIENPHGVTKTQIGLENVTNDAQVKRTEMGVANGVATLDANGKVPASQLPSYVDDVIEGYYHEGTFYEEAAHTTAITPETGKIYIDLSTNKSYRWGGSTMVEIAGGGGSGVTQIKIGNTEYNPTSGVVSLPAYPDAPIQPNWNETNTSSLSYIQNKPTIPAEQVQSDWNQTTTTAKDYIKNKPTIPAAQVNSDWNSSSGVSQILNKPTIPTTLPASDVYSWAKASSKPSYGYGEILYNAASDSVSGAVTVDGSTSLHVLTATANISSVSFVTAVPADGHSCHLIITATAKRTVAISNGSTVTIGGSTYTFKCPGAADISLSIKANGFVELDLLRVGINIYVRGV